MAYEGLFIDRSPCIRAAGIKSIQQNSEIKKCFEDDIVVEEAPSICIQDYPLPPKKTQIYKGFNTDVKECLQPESNKCFFDVLTKEFQETVYDSYWNKPLGKVRDPYPMIPKGLNIKEVCFGKPTPKSATTVADLVSPQKDYLDVMEDSRKGHDMYKRTHNDYDVGEKIARNYIDPFEKDLVYGKPTPCDPNGGCIKKVLNTDVDEKILVSKILADRRTRTKDLVGRVLAPNKNIDCVPKGHAFGKLYKREMYGVGELLKDCEPSADKIDLLEEFSSVNTLRQQIAKKDLRHRDLDGAFHQVDHENSGCLHINEVYQVLAKFKIFPEHEFLAALLKRLKILSENGMVAYKKLEELLNVNAPFPDVLKIKDCPKELLNFETTNQKAYRYHFSNDFVDGQFIPKAGIQSEPPIPLNSLISPSIYSNFGLEPTDFFVSRSPEYIRTLFGNLGCKFNDDEFKTIWCSSSDPNGCVSVNSFLKTLKTHKIVQ